MVAVAEPDAVLIDSTLRSEPSAAEWVIEDVATPSLIKEANQRNLAVPIGHRRECLWFPVSLLLNQPVGDRYDLWPTAEALCHR